jgi:hypothetical protein
MPRCGLSGGRRLALALALALQVAACRTPGGLSSLPAGDPRPQRLVAAFEQAAEARRALRARARVELEGASAPGLSGRQIVVAERPDHLRLELLGLFDQVLGVLAVDGDHYELFRVGDLSLERGPLHDDLLWDHARIRLRPEEAIALLLGAPLPEPGLVPVSAGEAEDGEIRVSLASPGGAVRRRIGFDPQGRLRRVEVLAPDGELEWSAGFGGYQPVGGVPFAHEITLFVAEGRTRVRIALRDVELNPQLPDGIFRVHPAPGLGAQ